MGNSFVDILQSNIGWHRSLYLKHADGITFIFLMSSLSIVIMSFIRISLVTTASIYLIISIMSFVIIAIMRSLAIMMLTYIMVSLRSRLRIEATLGCVSHFPFTFASVQSTETHLTDENQCGYLIDLFRLLTQCTEEKKELFAEGRDSREGLFG